MLASHSSPPSHQYNQKSAWTMYCSMRYLFGEELDEREAAMARAAFWRVLLWQANFLHLTIRAKQLFQLLHGSFEWHIANQKLIRWLSNLRSLALRFRCGVLLLRVGVLKLERVVIQLASLHRPKSLCSILKKSNVRKTAIRPSSLHLHTSFELNSTNPYPIESISPVVFLGSRFLARITLLGTIF